jgi:hypothetical protein
MASPFFFVSKKDSDALRPCQDYRYLNDGTVKNIYPLPLISNLLDKLKGANIFTKLAIFDGVITTSESRKATNGKELSKQTKDYSNRHCDVLWIM